MNFKRWLPLGLFLLLAFAATVIGSLATASGANTWYATLRKPEWTPPSWFFGPLWALLSGLMAVATWRAWRLGAAAAARRTVSLYSAQLTLNTLWFILFFGLRQPGAALAETAVLCGVSIVILLRFWQTERVAAALWVPCVAWSSFAAMFNAAVWSLNR
jgi:tryptophan-rich sensory protein